MADLRPQGGSLRERALALREEGLSSAEIAKRTGEDAGLIDRLTGHALDDSPIVMVTPTALRAHAVRYAFSTACLHAARVACHQAGNEDPSEEYLTAMADELERWLDLDKRLAWAVFETEREWLARQVREGMPS